MCEGGTLQHAAGRRKTFISSSGAPIFRSDLTFHFSAPLKVEELRNRLEEKNRLIEKKTQGVLQQQQERNRTQTELAEMKEHMDIKDRKINVLQRKIENLEDLLKEKDNQVDMARARLTAMQAHHCSSEGALTSLEEAIGDREKQMSMLR